MEGLSKFLLTSFLQTQHPDHGNDEQETGVGAGKVTDDLLRGGDGPFQRCLVLNDGEEGAVVQLSADQEVA